MENTMATPLTKGEFQRSMRKLMAYVASNEDVKILAGAVKETRRQLSVLTTSVDRLGHRQGADHDELVILRAR